MAKDRNGTLKWVVALIAIIGLVITLLTFVVKASWQASAVSKTLDQNCAEDNRVHPIAEKVEKVMIGVEKDVNQIQKDLSRVAETQKSIDEKLNDLVMMQLVGPGSGDGPTR